jgi:hypothetical protein
MISSMPSLGLKSVIALVTLLSLAWATPARAADTDNDDGGWFDSGPTRLPDRQTTDAAPAPARPAESAPATPDPVETDPRAITDFKPTLDPYGHWQQHPTYGLIWVPDRGVVGADFAPYVTSGRWALNENSEWIWVSDYPFGEVVFHYGRWVWVSGAGWAWVPGYRYAPAWVAWRVPTAGYAYVGWAPLPPTYAWFGGSAIWVGYGYSYPYVFCPSAYVFHRHVHRYVVHDRALIPRLAEATRRYDTPTNVRGVDRSPDRRFVSASEVRRSPTFEQARIPRTAVPSERVRTSSRAPIYGSRPQFGPQRLTPSNIPSNSFREPERAVPMTRPTMTARPTPVRPAPVRTTPVRTTPIPVRSATPRSYSPSYQSRPAVVRSTPRFHAESPRFSPRAAPPPMRSSPSPSVVRSPSTFQGSRMAPVRIRR